MPDYEFSPERCAWICYDNNIATARMLKKQYPEDDVALYDKENNLYTVVTDED